MKKAERLLVFLDLTEMDNLMIRYASFLSELLDTKEVYFLHAFEYDELPDDMSNVFPGLEEPLDKIIQEEIEEKISKYFSNENASTYVKLMEGVQITSILKWAEREHVDLMVVGKKISFKGKGNFAGKIARLAHSSVMFVTETSKGVINKILVPIDFSKFSELALKKAVALAEKTEAKILCQNVYRLPPQYFPYIPVKDENLEKIKKQHQDDFKVFMKKIGLSPERISCECTIDRENNVADQIYQYAVEQGVDLIVVGSKGKTDAASFLIGGVAERLISNEKNLPVMIVKDKDQTYGILDSIMDMKFS